jgi:hypothetical protein
MKDGQSNQLNLTVVALVALVAIVGLVALVMNAASVKFATGSKLVTASDDNLAGQASAKASSKTTFKYVDIDKTDSVFTFVVQSGPAAGSVYQVVFDANGAGNLISSGHSYAVQLVSLDGTTIRVDTNADGVFDRNVELDGYFQTK